MLRPDLRLLAMSATADGARLSGLMNAAVVESVGRMFPVTVEHQPRDIPHIRDLADAVAKAIRSALTQYQGDILAFSPAWRKSAVSSPPSTRVAPGPAAAWRPATRRAGPSAANGGHPPRGPGDVHRGNVIDRPGCPHRGGWRMAPHPAPRPSTGLTRLTTAASRVPPPTNEPAAPAVRLREQPSASGPPPSTAASRLRPPEILEAELSGLVPGMRRVGHATRRPRVPGQTARGSVGRRAALLKDLGALDPTAVSPTLAARWLGLAPIQIGRDDAGAETPEQAASPQTSPRCSKNATRYAPKTHPPTSAPA